MRCLGLAKAVGERLWHNAQAVKATISRAKQRGRWASAMADPETFEVYLLLIEGALCLLALNLYPGL
jgi:hypothetical protein